MEIRGRRIYGKPGNRGMGEADLLKKYIPRKTAPTYLWRPCLPYWEKEFTSKIGNINWEDFVEAKRFTFIHKNIMEWKDSACEEAFNAAKKRFWDEYNGYKSDGIMPDPDIYIEKNIDWDSKIEGDQMFSVSDAEEDQFETRAMNEPTMLPELRLEDIQPTGWDLDVPEITGLLTGLVVGCDHSGNEKENNNVLRDSNIGRELAASRKFHGPT